MTDNSFNVFLQLYYDRSGVPRFAVGHGVTAVLLLPKLTNKVDTTRFDV